MGNEKDTVTKKRVLKYDIVNNTSVRLWIPKGSVVISVHERRERVVLWIEVDETKPTESRLFIVVNTGQYVPFGAKYIGTAWVDCFVYHVYEVDESLKPEQLETA